MTPLGNVTGDVLTQAVELQKEHAMHTVTTAASSCPADRFRCEMCLSVPFCRPPFNCLLSPGTAFQSPPRLCAAPSQTRLPLASDYKCREEWRGTGKWAGGWHMISNPASLGSQAKNQVLNVPM